MHTLGFNSTYAFYFAASFSLECYSCHYHAKDNPGNVGCRDGDEIASTDKVDCAMCSKRELVVSSVYTASWEIGVHMDVS